MKIGNEDVKLYLGSAEISNIYLGTEQVYSGGSEPTPPHDYSQDYLTIESLQDNNTVYYYVSSTTVANTISASTDNGQTWSAYTSSTGGDGTTIATLDTGEKVLLKGLNSAYAEKVSLYTPYNKINTTARFNVYGNIMSMISGDSFSNADTFVSGYTFNYFFKGTDVVSTENLILPATTLTDWCYGNMFRGCTSLTTAPSVLPATTLAKSCYRNMFSDCAGLTVAPVLPATTVQQFCYNQMFQGCTSLNYVKCLATNISATNCTKDWVDGVAATGTFVKAASMSSWTTGNNGIPNGWTVQNDDGFEDAS